MRIRLAYREVVLCSHTLELKLPPMRHHEKERTFLLNTRQEDPNINDLNGRLTPIVAQLYLDLGKRTQPAWHTTRVARGQAVIGETAFMLYNPMHPFAHDFGGARQLVPFRRR